MTASSPSSPIIRGTAAAAAVVAVVAVAVATVRWFGGRRPGGSLVRCISMLLLRLLLHGLLLRLTLLLRLLLHGLLLLRLLLHGL
jgi:hypothetical protein